MTDLPNILEHTIIGPTDVLVLRVEDITPQQIQQIRDAIPDRLEGRVLVVHGDYDVIKKDRHDG